MRKYNILWLNKYLHVTPKDNKFLFLDGLRRDAERQYNMSIQTCIFGNDFLEFANDYKKNWDAFIVDAIGGMSEEESLRDVLGTILKEIDGIVEKQGILLYCLTDNIEPTNSSLVQLLDDYNFARTSTGERYFTLDYAKDLFQSIKGRLDENGKLFQKYPQIWDVYLEIKMRFSGICEETEAILNMLKWHAGCKDFKDFENGIRKVVEDICGQLCQLGFYNHKGLPFQPGQANFSLVTGLIKDIMERNKSNDQFFYSRDCRWNWEATAIYFLGDMANLSHHALQKENGNNKDYNEYYREMIFCAFVLFSKWYLRFKSNCGKNGTNVGWMCNSNYYVNSLPLDTTMQYQGHLVTDKYNNQKYVIMPQNDITGIRPPIKIDPSEPKKSINGLKSGQDVWFYLTSVNGKYYAKTITT